MVKFRVSDGSAPGLTAVKSQRTVPVTGELFEQTMPVPEAAFTQRSPEG